MGWVKGSIRISYTYIYWLKVKGYGVMGLWSGGDGAQWGGEEVGGATAPS